VIAQQIYLLAKTSHFDHAKDLSQDLDPEKSASKYLHGRQGLIFW
jgi:hypothetical protein